METRRLERGYEIGDRRCTKCGHTGPLDDFLKDARYKFGRKNLCAICWAKQQTKRQHRHRRKRHDIVTAYKDRPCTDCGQRYPHYVMDLDHVRGKKLFMISAAYGQSIPMNDLLSELEKCDVVCANCHRERSHQAGHLYRTLQLGPGKLKHDW